MTALSPNTRFTRTLAFLCAAFFLGCGGGAGQSTGPRTSKEPNKKRRAGPGVAAVEGVEGSKVDHWKHLGPYFQEFTKEGTAENKDPFKPQVIRFLGKEDLLRQIRALEPEVSTAESGSDVPTEILSGPLQAAPLSEFYPIIILTGVTQPKAVIIAPNGDAHEVEEGQRVGSEGGQIVDITQYQVKYRLPGQTRGEEIVQSLRPSLLDKIAGRASTLLQIRVTR